MTEFMIQIFPFAWIMLGVVRFVTEIGKKYKKTDSLDFILVGPLFIIGCIYGFCTNVGRCVEEQGIVEFTIRTILAIVISITFLLLIGHLMVKFYQVIIQ